MKKLLTIMTVMIVSLIGIISVNAAELNYTGQFRLQFYDLATGTTALTNVGPFNTGQTLSSGYGVSKVITRYYGQTFNAGTIYRVQNIVGFAPSEIASSFRAVDSIGCFGTTSSSSWNADSSLIASCDVVGINQIPNTNRIKYIVDITPASNVAGIQFNINYVLTEEVRTVNVYTASTITTGPDIAGSIDEQTAIIEEEFDNLSNIINENNQNLINSITEQNQVCQLIDKSYIIEDNKYLDTSGNYVNNDLYGISSYIKINNKDIITRINGTNIYSPSYCYYTIDKTLISCINNTNSPDNLVIPTNADYIRVSIAKNQNKPQYKICKNGNQAILDQDHNYQTDNTIDTKLEEEQQLKEDIFEELDFDYTENLNIPYNDSSLSYVWNKMTDIRGINVKIMGLITAIMGLGIVKLVLGR